MLVLVPLKGAPGSWFCKGQKNYKVHLVAAKELQLPQGRSLPAMKEPPAAGKQPAPSPSALKAL